MKRKGLLTTSGKVYWHFHLIGVGIIYTYQTQLMRLLVTCEFTGQIIEMIDMTANGGFEDAEDFKRHSIKTYKSMIENGFTMALDYMDDPTIVGAIGVDFQILQN